VRIATWNINGLRARLDFIRLWLADRQPDLVGLQELKTGDDEFPADAFDDLGYHVAWHGQKGWNGVAILCREPFDVTVRGLPGHEDFGARLIGAEALGLSFTTIYVPNGKELDHADFQEKLAWLDTLADYWSSNHDPSEPTILCGDFNIVPAHIDTWRAEKGDGRIFCTTQERLRFEALLQLGLHDLFREKKPAEQKFSWWDYRGGAFHRGQGLRIDFLLGTSAILEQVQDVTIDRDYRKKQDGLTASDHAPVIVDLG
jgi:exodeoxyribonuclease-3